MHISSNKFLLLSLMLVIMLWGCQGPGEEIYTANLHVFYKNGITKEDAGKLRDFLLGFGYGKNNGDKVTVQLVKKGDVYQVNVPIDEGIAIDKQYIKQTRVLANMISVQAFNNATVEIHLCDEKMNTKTVVEMIHESGLQTYSHDNYSIKYPSNWTLNEGKGYEFQLQSPVTYSENKFNMVELGVSDIGNESVTPLTSDQLQQLLVQQIANLADSSAPRILQKTTGISNGVEYAKVTYEFQEGWMTIRCILEAFSEGRKVYYLMAYANKITLDQYGYEQAESAILNSFELH